MDCLEPIYSQKNQCQDCYKCVRHCPVKAIRVADGSAVVMPERCIVCGHCVAACSFGAKQVRNDVRRARHLLERKRRVVVSLAPSFASEFPDASPGQLVRALKLLGFHAVSETALGAHEVSTALAGLLAGAAGGLFLSSACPVAVEYVRKYVPRLTDRITPLASPLLAHCRLLRRELGSDVGVVFVGPCIGKKLEADRHPELLDVALTFEDLRAWLDERQIVPGQLEPDDGVHLVPREAGRAALYPLVGGMNATLEQEPRLRRVRLLTASGPGGIAEALRGLEGLAPEVPVFVELLACEGGCVAGPKTTHHNPIASQLRVRAWAERAAAVAAPSSPASAAALPLAPTPVEPARHTEDALRQALWRIGKERVEDELNCGGCGYNSCRELAAALLAGMAEESMCVSAMRRLAQRKANALMQSAPFGVVIVDASGVVVDCNERFARMLGPEELALYEAVPGLAGVALDRLLPFSSLFVQELESGREIVEASARLGDRLLSVTLFTIEPRRTVGAMLQDVTQIETRREEIIQKAQQVIQGTLATVQDIAFRLGRNAAESEVVLNSIVECFGGRSGARDPGSEEPE